jgi:hypothetical protein
MICQSYYDEPGALLAGTGLVFPNVADLVLGVRAGLQVTTAGR